ncbi:MAG TPA: ribonuclease HII, partial [Flavobacteriaceae bacterium]|nr:ribonuclease HII [Flavobacteriaceae bacterium]
MLRYYNQKLLIAGTDEAGRGCLSGPVTAAAVILPKNFYHPMLDDSKKLSAKQRAILAPIIKQEAVSYGVSHV